MFLPNGNINRAHCTRSLNIKNKILYQIKPMKIILSSLAAIAIASMTLAAAPAGNIVEVASGAGSFNTLVAAVQAADLAETLSGDGPFTVFAPTDEAFAKLPEGTVATLLLPENKDQLVAILTYHVVPAKVMAADVATGEAPTVNGKPLNIIVSAEGVKVNGSNVVATDVEASNGVIHVIDSVIIPE
jgi:uncharacterized surface protein with fasciclin (FAS1) repeats